MVGSATESGYFCQAHLSRCHPTFSSDSIQYWKHGIQFRIIYGQNPETEVM